MRGGPASAQNMRTILPFSCRWATIDPTAGLIQIGHCPLINDDKLIPITLRRAIDEAVTVKGSGGHKEAGWAVRPLR